MKKQIVHRFDTCSMDAVQLLTEKHIRQGEKVVSLAVVYKSDTMFIGEKYQAILITEESVGAKK